MTLADYRGPPRASTSWIRRCRRRTPPSRSSRRSTTTRSRTTTRARSRWTAVDPALFLQRRAAAYQAYFEHLPLRRRSSLAGSAMQLFRRLRSAGSRRSTCSTRGNTGPINRAATGSSPLRRRAVTGCDDDRRRAGSVAQSGLDGSQATWNVLAQQVMFTRWNLGRACRAGHPRVQHGRVGRLRRRRASGCSTSWRSAHAGEPGGSSAATSTLSWAGEHPRETSTTPAPASSPPSSSATSITSDFPAGPDPRGAGDAARQPPHPLLRRVAPRLRAVRGHAAVVAQRLPRRRFDPDADLAGVDAGLVRPSRPACRASARLRPHRIVPRGSPPRC